jgi:hypothetical protein
MLKMINRIQCKKLDIKFLEVECKYCSWIIKVQEKCDWSRTSLNSLIVLQSFDPVTYFIIYKEQIN